MLDERRADKERGPSPDPGAVPGRPAPTCAVLTGNGPTTVGEGTAPALLSPQTRYRSLFENATWGIFQTSPAGQYLDANPALARIYGYDSVEALRLGLTDIARQLYVEPGRRQEFIELMDRLGAVTDFESEVYRRDGSRISITESVRAVRDDAGRVVYYEGFVEDISARKEAEARLKAGEERYALAAAGANDGLWDWDLVTQKVYYSARWKQMLGLGELAVGDSPDEWFSRIHPDDRSWVIAGFQSHLAGDSEHFQAEFRMRAQRGAYRWMLARGLAVRDAKGQAYRIAGSQTDVTERRLAEERLQHDALHDALTSLPNRTLLLDRLEQAMLQARRSPDQRVALLFIDLDRFKVVNDSLGHVVGDELLQETARRLQACVRPSDTVARFGGDEFVLLLTGLEHADRASRIAERVHTSLRTPFTVGGRPLHVTASIGVVVHESRYNSATELLRDADIAMYQAKARGRDAHVLFREELHGRTKDLLDLERDLAEAVRGGQLRVHYQPIVELDQGRVAGFEALVRWQHPERGLVSPGEFIPLAEESGLILAIGSHVLDQALAQLAAWRRAFPAQARSLFMSVNLSPRQLLQAELGSEVASALRRHAVDPCGLKLELTETALMKNTALAQEKLGQLRDLGIGLSLDDFGTGYSSLAYLHRFPFHTLKIDRSFVSNLNAPTGAPRIVRTILGLARSLEMDTVAEGIEREHDVAVLINLGCRYGQGYFFSPPVPAEVAEGFLRAERLPF